MNKSQNDVRHLENRVLEIFDSEHRRLIDELRPNMDSAAAYKYCGAVDEITNLEIAIIKLFEKVNYYMENYNED